MRAHEDSAEADEAGIRLHFAGITRVIFWENRLFFGSFCREAGKCGINGRG